MHIKENAIYEIVGENGAGKTTIMKLICELQKPTNGEEKLYDICNDNNKIVEVRKKMRAIIENPSINLAKTTEGKKKT